MVQSWRTFFLPFLSLRRAFYKHMARCCINKFTVYLVGDISICMVNMEGMVQEKGIVFMLQGAYVPPTFDNSLLLICPLLKPAFSSCARLCF